MLSKLFSWKQKEQRLRPAILFGRYSDNNKSNEQTKMWEDAEKHFKEDKFFDSLHCFFEYLKDKEVNNVVYERNGTHFKFDIYQGSKIIRGTGNSRLLHAKVTLARMSQPSVPVMRRLLEQNFQLYYSRYSLNADKLIMQFDSDINTANPNKLYYALKELAIVSDRQDDLLVGDFHSLEKLDTEHIEDIPVSEKEIKYNFLQKWISETLEVVKNLDAEKYAGGISYLLLSLIFRIDFLIMPEGAVMNMLEKTQQGYYKKDGAPGIEKNRAMIKELEKILALPKENILSSLFRSAFTFSIRQPKPQSTIAEFITNANKTMVWYKENDMHGIAERIIEYGIAYSQFSFSLPRPLTQLFQILMEVNYPEYFEALGFDASYYDKNLNRFRINNIESDSYAIIKKWKHKYPDLQFPREKLRYTSILEFNHSYTEVLAGLNFDLK